MKRTFTATIFPFLLFLIAFSSSAHATLDEVNDYSWSDKLGRGVLNVIASPVEVARTINVTSHQKGAGYGWTAGLLQGLGRMLVRFGTGAIDVVTSPFKFPDENRAPLIKPTYPWQEWGVDTL